MGRHTYCVCLCVITAHNQINIFLIWDVLLHPVESHLLLIRMIIHIIYTLQSTHHTEQQPSVSFKDWCICSLCTRRVVKVKEAGGPLPKNHRPIPQPVECRYLNISFIKELERDTLNGLIHLMPKTHPWKIRALNLNCALHPTLCPDYA